MSEPVSISKAERTRQYIIEKAAPVFNKKGYAGTSLSDIVEATGLTKGAIYGNFENKDEIALEAFDYNISLVINGIRQLQEQQETKVGKLKAILDFYRYSHYFKVMEDGCPIVNTGTEADDTHPRLKEKVKHAVRRLIAGVERLVMQAVEAGEVKPSINPASFAVVMVTMIEGGTMLAKCTGDPSFLKQPIQQIEAMLDEHVVKNKR